MLILLSTYVLADTRNIDIALDYNPESSSDSILGFTVMGSTFNWAVDDNNLCTLWTFFSEDTLTENKQCFGNWRCCYFIGADIISDYWNDDLNLVKGNLGVTDNNIVSAKIVYADYNLDANNPYSDIIYSNTASLPASFQHQEITSESGTTLTLTLLEGDDGQLNILPHSPDDNSYYSAEEDIVIKYFVDYETGTNVSCSLLIDDQETIKIDGFPNIKTSSTSNSLSEQAHTFKLECSDDSNNSAQSVERNLITDFTAPSITPETEDDYLTFMDYITLNYTASDSLSDDLSCRLFYTIGYVDMNVQSGDKKSIKLTDLDNGTYRWYIECTDEAGNLGKSENRTFYVDINQEFSIILNKQEFDLGQDGYYIITAPYGADTTVLITDPNDRTFFRHYFDKNYPVLDEINFTDVPGTYTLNAVLTYNNGYKEIIETLEVVNSYRATISVSEDEVAKGENIQFDVSVSGGMGDSAYQWDFGDGSTSTSKNPKHSFSEIDNYYM
jgi:hypothetical protein